MVGGDELRAIERKSMSSLVMPTDGTSVDVLGVSVVEGVIPSMTKGFASFSSNTFETNMDVGQYSTCIQVDSCFGVWDPYFSCA